jgi:DNA-binding transcriptional ArsR family regulator
MPMSAHRRKASLSNERVHLVATRARALGDPTRVRMLALLERGEPAVTDIAAALGLRHSTASKHLQVLFHAGLVRRRRDASVVRYSLSSRELPRICRHLATARLGRRRRADGTR